MRRLFLFSLAGIAGGILLFALPVSAQFTVEPKADILGLENEPVREFHASVRYNRVEGLFPRLELTLRPRKNAPLALTGNAGYGTASRRVGWGIRVSFKPSAVRYSQMGFGYFDDTFTNDKWLTSELTNSLAALFLRKDYYDYFRKRGVRAWMQKEFGESLHLRLEWSSARYFSLENQTDWSVFAYARHFRPNPPVAEGRENRLRLEFILDRLDNPIFPIRGVYLEGAIEHANGFLGGPDALENTGFFISFRLFQPGWGNQRAVVTGRFGHRSHSRAPQYLLDLGGVGTLRAYDFKEFRDRNTLAYVNVTYLFGGDVLGRLPLEWLPFYSSFSLGLFGETGALWDVGYSPPPGKNVVDHPTWKSSVGLVFSVTGGLLRINLGKRLDRSEDAWGVTIQLMPKW